MKMESHETLNRTKDPSWEEGTEEAFECPFFYSSLSLPIFREKTAPFFGMFSVQVPYYIPMICFLWHRHMDVYCTAG